MSVEVAASLHRTDEAAKVRLAERTDTPPEMLFFLSNDPAGAVRVAIAANAATPPLADRLLARDSEPGVRRVLARKLASLAPLLGPDGTDRHRRIAWEVLLLLTEDDVVAVRAAVTELVADLRDTPRPLILRLARDEAMAVAEPVLRDSPVLTEQDLLDLIGRPPAPGTVLAIARWPHLPESPSSAIAERREEGPVAALLSNATAHIREATLLALAAHSTHSSWQAALARRPGVSPAVVQALLGRPDLDSTLVTALRSGKEDAPPGPMNEEGFVAAARVGNRAECARLLAALSGLPAGIVARALEAREARPLVALCWKAGLSSRAATFAQLRLAGSPPEDLLILPGGEWAMDEETMGSLVEGLLRPCQDPTA